MSIFTYRTLQSPAEGAYKEKGSKFLAFAYPVVSETEIKERIDRLKKEYFDARHHCFAWVLGPDRSHVRAFDDGEPNHSAGAPILGQIRSKGITNVLIVVVRYFGGVKLGVGGLINAYKAAAEDVLNNSFIVEIEISEMVKVQFDYLILSDIMKIIKSLGVKIMEQDFTHGGNMKIGVPISKKEKLTEKFTLLQALGKKITWKVED